MPRRCMPPAGRASSGRGNSVLEGERGVIERRGAPREGSGRALDLPCVRRARVRPYLDSAHEPSRAPPPPSRAGAGLLDLTSPVPMMGAMADQAAEEKEEQEQEAAARAVGSPSPSKRPAAHESPQRRLRLRWRSPAVSSAVEESQSPHVNSQSESASGGVASTKMEATLHDFVDTLFVALFDIALSLREVELANAASRGANQSAPHPRRLGTSHAPATRRLRRRPRGHGGTGQWCHRDPSRRCRPRGRAGSLLAAAL